jgi:hypothetical protein
MIPPGSSPGMKNLASAPTTSPTTSIQRNSTANPPDDASCNDDADEASGCSDLGGIARDHRPQRLRGSSERGA